ncbi:MAG: plasmid pRiA4b ORF-3 family protein [Deltaproteobacteria bacterium]|nr:plasmid pRiA4b ORF-3 family protein [Deltaproteobacteria bacterium]
MKWQNLIFQFKITLQDIDPPIWRRIQVPAKYSFWDLHVAIQDAMGWVPAKYSFWDLHVAIQDAMGWFDCHLHAFRFKRPHGKKIIEIGIPIDEAYDINIIPSWKEYIADHCVEPGKTMDYEYDFGDGWRHEILFEGILLKEKGVRYPICLDGERACPPEDCGGVGGYQNLIEILRDPDDEEYQSTMEWLSRWYGRYDPEAFDAKRIKFDNPKKRWKMAFSEPH